MMSNVFMTDYVVSPNSSVYAVLALCRPSQVLYSVVGLDAIDVVYLWFVFGVGNECFCNEAMNLFGIFDSIDTQI